MMRDDKQPLLLDESENSTGWPEEGLTDMLPMLDKLPALALQYYMEDEVLRKPSK